MKDIIIAILEYFKVRHTRAFVTKMCSGNLQGNNLLGVTRLLEVFGVQSRAVRIDNVDDFKDLELPFICSTVGNEFILITSRDETELVYTDGKRKTKTNWDLFLKEVKMLAIMLSAKANSSEPEFEKHRREEFYQNSIWSIPVALIIWLLAMQFTGIPDIVDSIPSYVFRISALVLAATGLFLCTLLHRQWTGVGNAVEKVCAHFKTSNCSSAHDTFFFNKWFDLSEVGASYFLSIILIVLLNPHIASCVAWMILPALPASLWNLGYQFFKQKHWCPLCVGVQILFWIIAIVFLLCGAYGSPFTFNIYSFIYAMLLWGTLLVVMLKVVTPMVNNRHNAEVAQEKLSLIKGDKNIEKVLVGELGAGVRNITIAVSPTCPYCRTVIETIETILLPTGRFVLEKKNMPIHEGDKEIIENLIGKEEALQQFEWCDKHGVSATPTIFVNGRQLNNYYSIKDLLYL